MKKRVMGILLALAMSAVMMTGCSISEAEPSANIVANPKYADKKIGICIYHFEDNFMTLFRNELYDYLVKQGFPGENIIIADSGNSQDVQYGQIDDFIADGVNALIINLVEGSAAPYVTDKAVEADIPLIYINREPDDVEEQRWADNDWDVTYVGCEARQAGTFQGELIVDMGFEQADLNGDGILQYVMVEGNTETIDARYRTEYSVKAIENAGIEVECLADEAADWNQEPARQIMERALEEYGADIEVVFCNNDAMALGALQAIEAAGRTVGEDIFLVGVDALAAALENILDGKMTGTVFNDHISQAHNAANAAINYVNGGTNDYYISCDYVKVTKENAKEILGLLE